jgi:radial spoke head protein 9
MVTLNEIVHFKVTNQKVFDQNNKIFFLGLTPVESGKLSNYFHFREPVRLQQKSHVHRAALDKSVHFLDTIDEDIPKGITFLRSTVIISFLFYLTLGWSVQYERGNGLIQIRSLKWPGMAFFHIHETNRYGSLYFGVGEENKDLPFML